MRYSVLKTASKGCKFTPLGFETQMRIGRNMRTLSSVNLPRWGLKLADSSDKCGDSRSVNLPSWGLKRDPMPAHVKLNKQCKFTPLGFETASTSQSDAAQLWCKFTPLGFETNTIP